MKGTWLCSGFGVALPYPRWMRLCVSAYVLALLQGCGGGALTTGPSIGGAVPAAPTSLATNAGDAAVSLAWMALADEGSSPVTGYNVSVSPAVVPSQIVIDGTAAAIVGLNNGTEYAFAVTAVNSAGSGPPSASVRVTPKAFEGTLDFALACDYPFSNSVVSKIILLRSADHAKTFSYAATLLQPSDASTFNHAQDFNAPALLPSPGNEPPILIATPRTGQNGTLYSGCVIFPFASEQAGTLVRTASGLAISIATIPSAPNHFQGACAWDRGLAPTGILMDDLPLSPFGPFGIVATGETF